MELPNARLHLLETSDTPAASRRSFLQLASLAGAVAVTSSAAFAQEDHDHDDDDRGLTKGDRSILIAAEIAEALAVTTYTNIINVAPLFPKLASDDQEYLLAARQEEMSHYLLEQSVTGQPSPFTTFFYPPQMFSDAQTTLNVLVTLEDAFIAAYLVGVRRFSNANLRVTAAMIMGIKSDHRTLARVLAPNVDPSVGGPIEKSPASRVWLSRSIRLIVMVMNEHSVGPKFSRPSMP